MELAPCKVASRYLACDWDRLYHVNIAICNDEEDVGGGHAGVLNQKQYNIRGMTHRIGFHLVIYISMESSYGNFT